MPPDAAYCGRCLPIRPLRSLANASVFARSFAFAAASMPEIISFQREISAAATPFPVRSSTPRARESFSSAHS